jgi:hypothetical protein
VKVVNDPLFVKRAERLPIAGLKRANLNGAWLRFEGCHRLLRPRQDGYFFETDILNLFLQVEKRAALRCIF